MKSPDYIYFFTPTDKVRIMFRQNKGKIEKFIVQYLSLINNRWRTIMRIDTCHGYAHKHTFHLHSKQYIINLTKKGDNLNKVFTESKDFIKNNFMKIRGNFLNS